MLFHLHPQSGPPTPQWVAAVGGARVFQYRRQPGSSSALPPTTPRRVGGGLPRGRVFQVFQQQHFHLIFHAGHDRPAGTGKSDVWGCVLVREQFHQHHCNAFIARITLTGRGIRGRKNRYFPLGLCRASVPRESISRGGGAFYARAQQRGVIHTYTKGRTEAEGEGVAGILFVL